MQEVGIRTDSLQELGKLWSEGLDDADDVGADLAKLAEAGARIAKGVADRNVEVDVADSAHVTAWTQPEQLHAFGRDLAPVPHVVKLNLLLGHQLRCFRFLCSYCRRERD